MYKTRKFVMAILHGKQGLLCDKSRSICHLKWSRKNACKLETLSPDKTIR